MSTTEARGAVEAVWRMQSARIVGALARYTGDFSLAEDLAQEAGYGPGTPREGWDHSTPYLRRIFGDVFGAEVTLVVAELTAADTDPAMAAMRPRAEQSRAAALALAGATATRHAARRHSGGATATRQTVQHGSSAL